MGINGEGASGQFLDKKEVARKGDNRPPHIRRVRFTEFQGEDDGQPFKHRHRHLPLFKVKVGRFPMVVKEQFFFRPAGSIPGFDCQSLARSRSRCRGLVGGGALVGAGGGRAGVTGDYDRNIFLVKFAGVCVFPINDLPPVTWSYQICAGNSAGNRVHFENKKGLDLWSKPLILLMVAGTGFEPVTFGL